MAAYITNGQPFNDTIDPSGATCSQGTSECYSACTAYTAANQATPCVYYLASDCWSACCENMQFPQQINTNSTSNDTCSPDGVSYWTTNLPKGNVFSPLANDETPLQYCNVANGAVLGDPHFFGFDGTPFFFDGRRAPSSRSSPSATTRSTRSSAAWAPSTASTRRSG